MTDRQALDDWLGRAARLTAICEVSECGRPAGWESWHPDEPGRLRPLCDIHVKEQAHQTATWAGWQYQLAGL